MHSHDGETELAGGSRGDLSDQALLPDAPDAGRDFGARLRDAAAGAGQHRRHPVRCGRHDQSGREGAAREGARARSTDRHPICPLDRRLAARRPRLFLRIGKARSCRDRAAHSDHRQARLSRARLLGAVRGSARGRQRGAAEHPSGLRPARAQPERAVDAGLLARTPDLDGLRVVVRDAADLYRAT